jgi:hypothetical protein
MKWLIGVIVLLIAGGITFAVIGMKNWEDDCKAAGGHSVSQFEGFITTYTYIYDSKGNITGTIPQLTPQYSYHCMVGNEEIEV